jgi:hypothetical protein
MIVLKRIGTISGERSYLLRSKLSERQNQSLIRRIMPDLGRLIRRTLLASATTLTWSDARRAGVDELRQFRDRPTATKHKVNASPSKLSARPRERRSARACIDEVLCPDASAAAWCHA